MTNYRILRLIAMLHGAVMEAFYRQDASRTRTSLREELRRTIDWYLEHPNS